MQQVSLRSPVSSKLDKLHTTLKGECSATSTKTVTREFLWIQETKDAKCLIPSLRDFTVTQVSWFEVEEKVKRGQVLGMGTVHSNNLRAALGQRGDPGM